MTESRKHWIWAIVIFAAILIYIHWEKIEKKIKGDTAASTTPGASGLSGSGGGSGSLKSSTLSDVKEPATKENTTDPTLTAPTPKTYSYGAAEMVFNNFSNKDTKTAFL